ncbi:hypothetical protein FRC18_008111 [Serendipita sp. 400]|nr:hypothetical protein FRC18_008111 [Serendipita sp. 400]
MGSSEYGPHLDAIRPGGLLVSVPLRTTTKHFNVTEGEVYYAIGDRESILPLMISYVTWCHILPAWPSKFDPALSNSTIKLENVIQYFRASSFALATPAYNNTFARQTTTTPSSDEPSSPLPESIQYSPFRLCIDNVTFNALAIMNQPPSHDPLTDVFVRFAPGMVLYVLWALLPDFPYSPHIDRASTVRLGARLPCTNGPSSSR